MTLFPPIEPKENLATTRIPTRNKIITPSRMQFTPPIKKIFYGNKVLSQSLIKVAQKQLITLEREMSHNKLNKGRSLSTPFHGASIECLSSLGTREVRIFTPDFPGREYQDRVLLEAEKPRDREEEEEILGVQYFVRIKHSDPDENPYSAPFPSNYKTTPYEFFSLPAMDRLIVWDFVYNHNFSDSIDPTSEVNRANNFVPGNTTIVCDVDVEANDGVGIVYYPENLTAEIQVELINAVRATLNVTPSRKFKEPIDRLEDLAQILFVTGGTSPPDINAARCSKTYIPNTIDDNDNSIYDLDETFAMESTSALTGCFVPSIIVIDDDYVKYQDDWCPSSSGSLTYYNDTFNFHGLDIAVNIGPFRATPGSIPFIQKDARVCYDSPPNSYGYIHNVGNLDGGVIPELIKGVLYTGASLVSEEDPTNNFNCFFMSEYLTKSSGDYSMKTVGQGMTWSGSSYYIILPDGMHHEVILGNTVSGIMTPLEVLPLSDIAHYESDVVACEEYACAYEVPGDFGILAYSNAGKSVYDEFPLCGETPFNMGDMTRCYIQPTFEDDNWSKYAWRETVGYSQTSRSDFHIAPIKDAYFISLSHLHEARGAQKATSKFIDPITSDLWGPRYCNGIFGHEEEGPLTEIAYICYIFSPKDLMKQDEIDPNITNYWDINEAKRSDDIINPYRCLDIEEYVNTALGEIQVSLDEVPDIPLCGGTSAYPMREYGFGITDGFIKK